MRDIKKDFPFFTNIDDVYFDNAATTQKPQVVLDKIMEYYTHYCANIHRGAHGLGNRATQEYENVRELAKEFIGANDSSEIVFTKGTTESINLVAQSFVKGRFSSVIISELEHHSNIVPWQLSGFIEGENLFVVPLKDDLSIDLPEYEKLLREHPCSFVSVTHISNAFGIVNPIALMGDLAHRYNSLIMVDGAQSIAHTDIKVKELGVDFYVFSSHKMYGPTGVGVLYAKYEYFDSMKPYQGGGTMIEDVEFLKSTYLPPPHRFEAGTQNIAGVIGFGEAIKYIKSVGYEFIKTHDSSLMVYAKQELEKIEGLKLFTQSSEVCGNISFTVDGIHHNDIGILLDKQKITLRTGHHCALPAMKMLGINGTVRLSFAIYNSLDDVDKFIKALKKAMGILR